MHFATSCDVVRLFVVDYATIDDALLKRCADVLDEDEKSRAARFLFERDRRSFVISHGYLRCVLSYFADVPARDWQFVHSTHGKPEIAAPQLGRSLRFNLSHSRGAALVGVVEGSDLGVDIEAVGRDASCVELADRYFSPLETAELRSLPVDHQRDRFFEYWTLKEAYIKARGLGLAIPLDRFSYRLQENRPTTISFADGFGDVPEPWRFVRWRPSTQFQAAAAVRSSEDRAIRFEYCLNRPFDPQPASFQTIC